MHARQVQAIPESSASMLTWQGIQKLAESTRLRSSLISIGIDSMREQQYTKR